MSSREDIRHRIIGDSPALKGVLDRVALLARFPKKIFVIIIGEPGTGKELIAQLIHDLTAPEGPFIAENCAAVPEPLAESHYFGHETGSFTGADKQKKGAFERAHKGTLFLDEIQALPLEMQSKLNRALAELQIQRVGGSAVYKLDLRIITATNCNLEEMVKQKLFKEDFFQRINVFPIVVPSLRDRPEDILPLANHFLKQIAPEKKLGLSATNFLQNNICPGNIRVLNNLVTAAAVMSGDSNVVDVTHIKPVLTWKLPGYDVLGQSQYSNSLTQTVAEDENLPLEGPPVFMGQNSNEDALKDSEWNGHTASVSSLQNYRNKCASKPSSCSTPRSVRQKMILAVLAENDSPLSSSELHAVYGASKATMERDLTKLVEMGSIQRMGRGRNTRYMLNNIAESTEGNATDNSDPGIYPNENMDEGHDDISTAILNFAVEPKSITELMRFVGRQNRSQFRKSVVRPLLDAGLLEMTNPNYPMSKNQKYVVVTTSPE